MAVSKQTAALGTSLIYFIF